MSRSLLGKETSLNKYLKTSKIGLRELRTLVSAKGIRREGSQGGGGRRLWSLDSVLRSVGAMEGP